MTQDEIIRMAREADIYCWHKTWDADDMRRLERFAALVREDERESNILYRQGFSDAKRLQQDEREKIAVAHKIRPRGKSVYHEFLAEREKQQVVSSKMEHTTQEPVAYKYKESSPETGEFVFAAPVSAKREWVDLTDDELRELIRKEHDAYCLVNAYTLKFARAVIAAYKEKQNELVG